MFLPTFEIHEGRICHVEAEYFYPGIWEKYGENELICNYWNFSYQKMSLL